MRVGLFSPDLADYNHPDRKFSVPYVDKSESVDFNDKVRLWPINSIPLTSNTVMQCNAIQCNNVQWNAMQCNAM